MESNDLTESQLSTGKKKASGLHGSEGKPENMNKVYTKGSETRRYIKNKCIIFFKKTLLLFLHQCNDFGPCLVIFEHGVGNTINSTGMLHSCCAYINKTCVNICYITVNQSSQPSGTQPPHATPLPNSSTSSSYIKLSCVALLHPCPSTENA